MRLVLICIVWTREKREYFLKYIKAQIHNSLSCGWKKEDICLVTNFAFSFLGVEALEIPFSVPPFARYSCKTFCVYQLLKRQMINEPFWLHDLDVWQLKPLPEEIFSKNIGISKYIGKEEFNTGSIFYRPRAIHILEFLSQRLLEVESNKEEKIYTEILKNEYFQKHVEVLDTAFNIGMTHTRQRLEAATIPIIALHFKPERASHFSKFSSKYKLITDSLKEIFIEYELRKT